MFTPVEQMTAMDLVEEVRRTRPAWEAELVDLEHLLGDEEPVVSWQAQRYRDVWAELKRRIVRARSGYGAPGSPPRP